jgi:hypothetical protein
LAHAYPTEKTKKPDYPDETLKQGPFGNPAIPHQQDPWLSVPILQWVWSFLEVKRMMGGRQKQKNPKRPYGTVQI